MNLRTKVVMILAGMWAAIFITVFAGSGYFFLTRIKIIENNSVQLEIERAKKAFQGMERSLKLLASDWGLWDDAYDFYLNKSNRFIDANFQNIAFKNAGLNFILFFDVDGNLYYGKSYSLTSNQFFDIPRSLTQKVKSGIFQNVMKSKAADSGLMSLPEGDLIFSVSPVLKSDGSGEPRGILLMGFYLTPSNIAALSKAVKMPVYFSALPVSPEKSELAHGYVILGSDESKYAVHIFDNKKYIYGFTKINDYFGKPAGILGVKVKRTLVMESASTILSYLALFILLGVVILVSVWYLLKVFVLDRIMSIQKQLDRISSGNKFSERVHLSGQDELKSMVNEINTMLNIIELAEDQLKARIANRTNQLEQISVLNKNLFDEINRQRSVEENLREHEKFLQKYAYYDQLTGIPNRMFFREQVQKLIERAEKNGSSVVIMFLDADKFKSINDTYGHSVGDAFLTHVAESLKKIIKDSDMIARYAGDEFVIFMNNIKEKSIISLMAEKILREASKPFFQGNISIQSTFSLGISIYPNDGKNISELEHSADLAMYHAKKNVGNVYCFASDPEASYSVSVASSSA